MPEEDYEVDEAGALRNHELLLTYDEFSACEEKPVKKKSSKKRARSPSPGPGETPKSKKRG